MNPMNGLNKMFGKIAPGMCRLSYNGGIAIKTSDGYKKYDVRTGKLTNCSSFVFDIGEDMFFLIPTNKVEKGDIILVNNKPVCVISADKTGITVFKYEDSTIATVVPERHMFMGNTYFYAKVVSMFGNMSGGKNGMKNVMQFMMMSEMMKGNTGGNSAMNNMLPLMMMGGGNFSNMFEGMFDEIESVNNESEEE